MKITELKEGTYYWVIYKESEMFIAQYEGEYWYTDISTPTEEFYENHKVIEEIKPPKGFMKGLKLFNTIQINFRI